MNGGQRHPVPGTWSSTLAWLVTRLAPRFPSLAFLEVRYRVKSWTRLESCVEDARAAIDVARAEGAGEIALLGFSMGGAVATLAAGDDAVTTVIGVAPWLPDELDVSALAGRRLAVVHGSLDRAILGIPGVSPELSRRGFDRALAAGATGTYTVVRGGLHGAAVGGDRPRALPRARRFLDGVAAELELFAR